MMKTAYINILESSTVTLSAGSAHDDYPLYRLYDRQAARLFMASEAATIEVHVDQGAAPAEASCLLIPAGHNLEGMTLDLMHSDDDQTYTPAVEQWTGAEGLMDKSWPAVSKRYWRFIVTSPATTPAIGELFITQAYEWARNPSRSSGPFEPVFNVIAERTSAGLDRFLVLGPPRRRRYYSLDRCPSAQSASLMALYEAAGTHMPFWLCDHEGHWIFGRLVAPLEAAERAAGVSSMAFKFEEVLS